MHTLLTIWVIGASITFTGLYMAGVWYILFHPSEWPPLYKALLYVLLSFLFALVWPIMVPWLWHGARKRYVN